MRLLVSGLGYEFDPALSQHIREGQCKTAIQVYPACKCVDYALE